MHELSICRALRGELEALVARHGARGVASVTLRIGPLSGVEPALLRAAFPLACAGSSAGGSSLLIEEQPLRVRCRACGAETHASASRLACAACGDAGTQLVGGDELLLASVELAY
jgi:hydrogenase nickel incorporation protein HypA/HybF